MCTVKYIASYSLAIHIQVNLVEFCIHHNDPYVLLLLFCKFITFMTNNS